MLLSAFAFCYPTKNISDCDWSLAQLSALMDAHIEGNRRFPQLPNTISYPIVAYYLSEPVSARILLRTPTAEEASALAQSMDRLHSAYDIPHHTEEKAGDNHKVVPQRRLVGLASVYSKGALDVLAGVAKTFGAKKIADSPWGGKPENAALLDEIFIDPEQAVVAERLFKFGRALKRTLALPEVMQAEKDYRRSVVLAYRSKSNDLTYMRTFTTVLWNALKAELRKELPELTDEELNVLEVYVK
jgi:hypothetical protein